MQGIKILLINPRISCNISLEDKRAPLPLAYLAAYIRSKYEVQILDLMCNTMTDTQVYGEIRKKGYNVVGFTGMSHQIPHAYGLSSFIKEKSNDIKIIFGGVHATFCYDEAFEKGCADFVIRGEGEATFLELLNALSEGKKDFIYIKGLVFKKDGSLKVTQDREFLDIDSLPFPARDLLPMEQYCREGPTIFGNPIIEVMFSRGCPYNCIFCVAPSLWKRKVRIRSLDKVIDELKHLIQTYSIKYFCIKDDTFTVNKKWITDFCERVIKERLNIKWRCLARVDSVDIERLRAMKKAGCVHVAYGIESGNQKILDFENKDITIAQIKHAVKLTRKAGIPIDALMIVGHPFESRESILESKKLIEELKPFNYVFQPMTPYVGTALEREIAKTTGEIVSRDWNDYVTLGKPLFIPHGFDRDTLEEIKNGLNRKNSSLSRVLRRIIIATGLIGMKTWNKKFVVYPIYHSLPAPLQKIFDALYRKGGRAMLYQGRRIKNMLSRKENSSRRQS